MKFKLKEWRKFLSYKSRTAFAKALGIEQTTYDRMEKNADTEIKIKYLIAIAELANVPVEALLIDPKEYRDPQGEDIRDLKERLAERDKDIISLNNEFRKFKDAANGRIIILENELKKHSQVQ